MTTSRTRARRAITAAVVTAAAAAAMLPATASAGYSDAVRGWWPFAEGRGQVARDWSGNGNHGELGSAPGADANDPTWVRGVFGTSALQFGGDDFVRVPDSRDLEPQQLTVSAWVKASASPGTFKYVLGKGGEGCVASSYALTTGGTGGLGFYIWDGGGELHWGGIADPAQVWDGRWHHVAGTFDGTDVRFFLDGNRLPYGFSSPVNIKYDLPTSGDTGFGQYLGDCDLFFTGAMDEVMLFSQALPIEQIWQRWRWLLASPALGR
jgi:hypothetical protein